MVRIGPFHKYSVLASAFLVIWASHLRAESLPPVVARYEQMLVRSPGKGTAFDRVYQHFFEGEGVEQLAQRWKSNAEAGGPLAANYWLLGGLLAERQGRADDALRAYQRVVELKPDDYRAWAALGDLQAGAGKFGEAIQAFEKALAAGAPPDIRPKLYTQLARSFQRNFNIEGAVRTWEKFVAESPNDPFVLEEAGEALAEADRYTDAKATFEKLRDMPGADAYQRVRAMLKLAHLEEQQGRAAAAQEVYEKALPLASDTSWINREVRARIEDLFRRRDDLPGLVAYYEKALAARPKDVETAVRLSDALVELNKKKESVEWLRKAAEWAPNRNDVQLALAKRLSDTGSPKDAVEILTQLSKSGSDESIYAEQLGDAHWFVFESSKDDQDKTRAIEAWRKLAPDSAKEPVKIARLGDLFRARGLADLAVTEYRRAIAAGPELHDLRERLADYLFELGRTDDAWKEVDGLATGEQPDWFRLARLQQRHKRPDLALESVRKGLERDPKNFDLLSFEWHLLAEDQKWEEALALFDRLSESAPNAYFADEVEQRYLLALASAEKAEAFKTERVAQLGKETLSERDLRLLGRLALTAGDLDLLGQILKEGRSRFPDSVSLTRLEVEHARRSEDHEGRMKALRRLVELQPKQKTDWLREIITAHREQEQWDEALAVARELIAASPANADMHVGLADLQLAAGKFEEGVKTLRDAVKLSDQPVTLLQRLSRIYMDRGDTVRGRAILDEAFEAAEKPADRLALMQLLSEAYFADNKLDELIARFRQRQSGEDDGWRYALYLAEIYKNTLDYGAARRELGRALAARPKDAGLLRQMVKLASDEQNKVEELRYQTLLTEAEPTDGNQYALIEALLENQQGEAAMRLVQRHFEALKKMPGAWDRLLPLLKQNGQLEALNTFLSAMPGAQNSLEAKSQLAIIQAAQGNMDAARRIFWSVFDARSAGVTVAPSAKESKGNGAKASPHGERLSTVWQTRNTVQRMLEGDRYSSVIYSGSSVSRQSNVDPVDAARDLALLYLAGIAVKQQKIAEFLKELDEHLASRNSTRLDRLIAYSMVDAKQKTLEEIRAQVRQPEASKETDGWCFGQLMNLLQSNRYESVKIDIEKSEAEQLYRALFERLDKAEIPTRGAWSPELQFYSALGDKEKAREARRKWLETADLTKPEGLMSALNVSIASGNPEKVRQLIPLIVEAMAKKTSLAAFQQLQWMPAVVVQDNDLTAEELLPETRMQILAELLSLWYPDTPPRQALGGGTQRYYIYGEDTPLPPTRYLDNQRLSTLSQIAMQMGGVSSARPAKLVPGIEIFRKLLEEQSRTLPEAKRIYPKLILLYLDVWGEKDDAAMARAQQLIAEQPEDEDLQLLTGALLGRAKKYAEALAILQKIRPKIGSANTDLQRQILTYAKLADDKEAGRKAALRLASMRISPDERRGLVEALRQFGLGERAAQIEKTMPASPGRSGTLSYENYQMLEKLTKQGKRDEAIALAAHVLSSDPSAMAASDHVVRYALNAYYQFGKLSELIEEYEKALAETPDSLRLNYLLAVAKRTLEAPKGGLIVGPKAKLPYWVKLTREGDKFTGFYSADGAKWTQVGNLTLDLPGELQGGVVLVGRDAKRTSSASLTDVSITTVKQQAAVPDSGAATSSPWIIKDIGQLKTPGVTNVDGQALRMESGKGQIGSEADAIHFAYQSLQGDSTMVAKIVDAGNSETFGEAGIMFRVSDDPKAHSVSMVVTSARIAYLKYRYADGSSEKYWRKIATMRPDDDAMQRAFAQWLQHAGKEDEAFAVYKRLSAKAPEELMRNMHELVSLYKKAKRLPELAEQALAWTPARNSGSNWSYSFDRLADALREEKMWDLVEKVCRRGVETSMYGGEESLTRSLIESLKEQGKKDEAFTVMVNFFGPNTAQGGTVSESQLGFQSHRYVDIRPNWLRPSINGNGIELSGLSLLDNADQQGMLERVGEKLRETYKGNKPEDWYGPALLTFLKLKKRDAQGLEEIRELSKQSTGRDSDRVALLMEAARELRTWPGQESLAMEIYRAVLPSMKGDRRQFLPMARLGCLMEIATLQRRLREPNEAEAWQAAVAELNEILADQSGSNRGYFDDLARNCLGYLLHVGMEKEYTALLKMLKTTPRGGDLGWTYDEERKMIAGEVTKPQAMLWFAASSKPDEPANELRVELRSEHPYDHGEVYKYLASRERSIPAMEKERTVKILYGRTPETLQPVGELVTTKTMGSWDASALPEGSGWLRAVVVEKNQNGEAKELPSPMVPIMRAPNLIQNPTFNGVAKRSLEGDFDITGWRKLPRGVWSVADGGPAGSGVVQYENLSGNPERILTGERISLEKGKTYFQSAWLRPAPGRSADIGRRYLDANGKEIKTTYFPGYTALNWRWHGQRLTFTKQKDVDVIPENAAFLELVIKVRGSAEWTGLYLGAAPEPTAEVAQQ